MLPKPPFPVLDRGHPLAQGLVLALPLYEGSGPTVNDLAGNGNSAALAGGVSWVGDQLGYALSFDGTSGYLNITSAQNLGFTGSYSLVAWVYYGSPADGSDRMIFCRGTGAADDIEVYEDANVTGQGLSIVHNRGNGGTFAFAGNNSNVNASKGGWGGLTRNVWTHLVVVFNAAVPSWTVYMNGVAAGTATINSGTLLNTSGGAWQIGNTTDSADFGSSRFWKGRLDSLGIYSRVLSPAEVAALYFDSFAMYRPADTVLHTASGGNTYNVSITEAASALDTTDAQAVFASSVTDAASATDAPTAAAVFVSAVTEAAAGGDTTNSAAIFASALTETATAADAITSTGVFNVTVSEAALATDSPSIFITGIPLAGTVMLRTALPGTVHLRTTFIAGVQVRMALAGVVKL